jgi:hypothetical protein
MRLVPSHDHLTWYSEAVTPEIEQGDVLFDCIVPIVTWDEESKLFGLLPVKKHIMVMSFTCDMIPQGKLKTIRANQVLVAPLATSDYFQRGNSNEARNQLADASKGKIAGLYAIPRRSETELPTEHYLVDFRNFMTMPLSALKELKSHVTTHVRLCSPYREHFAQTVASFFNRVALDEDPNFEYAKVE